MESFDFEEEKKFSNDELEAILKVVKRPSFTFQVIHKDSSNPRISKFGGVEPYLPTKGPIHCECHSKMIFVFSLYVSTLPDEVKSYFPSDHEYVLLGFTCESCFIRNHVEVIVDDEIDQLVYKSPPQMPFNQPRMVVGYERQDGFPVHFIEVQREFPILQQYTRDDLLLLDEEFAYYLNTRYPKDGNQHFNQCGTHLLGYPDFVQGDDRPFSLVQSKHVLLMNISEGEASTNMWGDCGSCQVWMTIEEEFGTFVMKWACC